MAEVCSQHRGSCGVFGQVKRRLLGLDDADGIAEVSASCIKHVADRSVGNIMVENREWAGLVTMVKESQRPNLW